MPFSLAAVRRAMSTVMMTSAGEFSPSAATRSSRPLSRNSTSRLDAGLGREGIEHRLDQFGLAVGVDVDRAVGERRPANSAASAKAALAAQ